jgi:hypothetical protein
LHFAPSTPLEEVRAVVAKELKCDPQHMGLHLDSRPVRYERSLVDAGVRDFSTIAVMHKLLGGMQEPSNRNQSRKYEPITTRCI